MRLIDVDAMLARLGEWNTSDSTDKALYKFTLNRILEQPTIEPEIVRCKDCKYRGEKPISDGRYWCYIHAAFMYYCSDAERRTDEGEELDSQKNVGS